MVQSESSELMEMAKGQWSMINGKLNKQKVDEYSLIIWLID